MHEVTINGVRYIPAPPVAEKPELLDTMYDFRDVGYVRIRDYLRELLTKVWVEESAFKGKWPWGNSGWQYQMQDALVKAGAVEGTYDKENDEYDCTEPEKAEQIIIGLIAEMCKGPADVS